jgi:peptidoglycan/LPS O-acetylase OafA/YrhL
MKTRSNSIIAQNRVFLLIALVTGLVLLIPLIAMQFTDEVDWGLGDFVVMGALLFGMGSLFVLAARKVREKYWPVVGIALALVLLYLWAELAVGIFTNWGS